MAIQTAEQSYDSNLERIRGGARGCRSKCCRPSRHSKSARRAYLRAVVEHNQSQFQLQWALGWPVTPPAESF